MSLDYPDVAFLMGSSLQPDPGFPNFAVFDNYIQDASYLTGIIAGAMTKTGNIGMVGGFPIPEVNRLMNAFMAGREGDAAPTSSSRSPSSAAGSIRPRPRKPPSRMIDAGADLLYAERFGVSDAAKERGVLAIGNVIDTQPDYPETVVASALWHFEPTLAEAIAEVKAGTFKAADYGVYSFMKEGGCSLAPLGTFEGKVPEDAMALVAETADGDHGRQLHRCDQRRRAEVELIAADQMAADAPALRLDGITKRFGPLVANDAICFELRRGEVIALLGENGAGKTTLMNILFGHYVADEGSVEAFGQPLPPGEPRAALAAGIGMVHQHFTLADNMTVLENIALGTRSLWRPGYGRAAARAKIAALAARFGLAVDPDARVGDLTVGERQRVEILKALYRDARILILDEPTAVLTPQEAEALFATLRRMVADGLSIIFISHKLGEVMAVTRPRARAAPRPAGRRPSRPRRPTAPRWRALMVGADVPRTEIAPAALGPSLLTLADVSTAGSRRGAGPARGRPRALRAGEITGLAGVSGNGQAALAALIAGLARPASGRMERARASGRRRLVARARRWRPASGASPRTATTPAPSAT